MAKLCLFCTSRRLSHFCFAFSLRTGAFVMGGTEIAFGIIATIFIAVGKDSVDTMGNEWSKTTVYIGLVWAICNTPIGFFPLVVACKQGWRTLLVAWGVSQVVGMLIFLSGFFVFLITDEVTAVVVFAVAFVCLLYFYNAGIAYYDELGENAVEPE